MIGLLQRVTHASVTIDDNIVTSINSGLLVFIGIEKSDSELQARQLIKKIISYRVFADDEGKMNLSLKDINGGLLLVPQFTLAADTRKGLRPGFSDAAPPDQGKQLFDFLTDFAHEQYSMVETGIFGADMQITLNNNGPVTFWLQT